MQARWLVVVMVIGCGESKMAPVDAMEPQNPAETCAAQSDAAVDFLGEPCTEAPYPGLTPCHGDAGWCIAGTCRPTCNRSGCRKCDEGSYVFSDRGACYCTPD